MCNATSSCFVRPSVGPSTFYSFYIYMLFITSLAHPHATWVAVYLALFVLFSVSPIVCKFLTRTQPFYSCVCKSSSAWFNVCPFRSLFLILSNQCLCDFVFGEEDFCEVSFAQSLPNDVVTKSTDLWRWRCWCCCCCGCFRGCHRCCCRCCSCPSGHLDIFYWRDERLWIGL